MSGDQIAGSIGIALMLVLVLSGLLSRRIPHGKLLRMAVMWILIVAVITAVVMLLQR